MKKLKDTKSESKLHYNIEITVTDSCNFRCDYCFENKTPKVFKNFKDLDLFYKRVDELLNSEWFKETFSGLQITFWGGEPFVNYSLVKEISNHYADDERVHYFVYTNGSFSNELLDWLDTLRNKKCFAVNKVRYQISYDGNPVHDLCRRDTKEKPTSKTVLETINRLAQNDCKIYLKATVPHKYLKYIDRCWNDIHELYKRYTKPEIKYALTVDYHSEMSEEYFNEAEEAVLRVARKEIEFYKENKRFLSTIFDSHKKLCIAGKAMAAINIDGNVYTCHGAMYSKNKDYLKITSIYDSDFVERLKNIYELIPHPKEPDICENCISLICLRCNVLKYEMSKKEGFAERWTDYTAQKDLCEFYKMTGRIGRALYSLIKEGN